MKNKLNLYRFIIYKHVCENKQHVQILRLRGKYFTTETKQYNTYINSHTLLYNDNNTICIFKFK